MENSICLLGDSQTFVGVLATLAILCITRNSNNFIYGILKDIKAQIIEYTQKLKPDFKFNAIKKSGNYKSIFLFSQNEKYKNENKELYDACINAVAKVNVEKFALQAKLTDWDRNIIGFTDAIENKKEQQKGPMFAFAYCVLVFVFDELLRSKFIPYNQELLSVLILFTLYVSIYWFVKWIVFICKDDNKKGNINKGGWIENMLYKLMSLKNSIQFLIHVVLTFVLLFLFSRNFHENDVYEIIKFFSICYIPFIMFGFVHIFIREENSDTKITMHYVYHFFYMFLLSVCIMLFSCIFIPNLFLELPHQSSEYFFFLKFLIIGIVLCVGLLCPFFCPLLKYNMVYIKANIRLLFMKIQAWIKEKCLLYEFKELAEKIECK